MQIQPYLFFNGRAEEAIRFYEQALGARVETLLRYRDAPEPPPPGMLPPGSDDKVMHASVRIEDAVLMISDGRCTGSLSFAGFSLSLSVPDAARAEQLFDALRSGGHVVMPLGQTFWSPCFGMVVDRFGVDWMINAEA